MDLERNLKKAVERKGDDDSKYDWCSRNAVEEHRKKIWRKERSDENSR